MKQKGLAPILIVLLIALGLGGYLIYQKQAKPVAVPQQTVQSTPAPTSNSESTNSAASPISNMVSDTTNWKVYRDDKNNIEFKYPENWYAQQESGWTLNVFLDNHAFEIPKNTEFMTPIQLDFNEIENTTTNTKFFQDKTLNEGVKRISSLYDSKSINVNNLEVSGKKAAQISGVFGPGMLEGHYFKYTLIQMDNKLLMVSLSNREFDSIYNQILSTFKFTQ